MLDSDSFFSHETRKDFHLTVIRLVLCSFLAVLGVLFSVWVALARLLGLRLIIIGRIIVGVGEGLQFPRLTFSVISLRIDIMGSWKTFVLIYS